ncbi:MAG: ATP-binding protein [Leptospirales bacterium]|nr:ATP-binding protein [Leptospirales bacterium]
MIISLMEILFILIFYIAIQLFIFIKNKKSKLLLINAIPSLLLIIPELLKNKGIILSYSSLYINIGLIIYPFIFMLLFTDYFPIDKKNHLLKSLIVSIPFLVVFIIFEDNSIILLMHVAIYTFLLFSVKYKFIGGIITLLFMIIYSAIICYYNYNFHRTDILIVSLVLLYVVITFFVVYEYSRMLKFSNIKYQGIKTLNKRLNQIITRLRMSNDTLKEIISQKDIELLQIARHASLAEITTGIAHELAQPLTGIKGIAQNMIDDINLNEFDALQGVADLTKMSSLVDRSSSIIDHIRTFTRKRNISFQQVDLNASILNAIELINNQMKNSGIDIIFALDDSLPKIYGDNLSLEQLFINLTLNSRDAILAKKDIHDNFTGIIKITTFHDNKVKLVIEDNGNGIPKDIIPKIWTPFFTTKMKGNGTGIGLSLSHRIIEEHNADVSIDSSNEGTIFTIIFPIEYSKVKELT